MNHFFLPRDDGQRLCVYHAPRSRSRALAAVVHVHAFGEEMNKSRHMVAQQSRALAQAGCAVLQIDLLGCGDSSGDHGDATWAAWLADVEAACQWLEGRHADAPRWLWGHRIGALLAAEVAAARTGMTQLLLWQPMVSGKTLVQQLNRLRAAAHLGDATASREALAVMRRDIAEGRSVEVAGYSVSAALMLALESAAMPTPRLDGRVHWLDVSPRAEAGLAPSTRKMVTEWQAAGVNVQAQVIEGPAFWQATEIEQAPRLLQATVDVVLASAEVHA